ncbi:MAG: endolytic transglycosylase MltG [Lewinellaceae bacterium]|nr:endolytic transglycosylase MltG [Saprospiraceae bacterium]MCB0542608.1 endolytic transglycosylase MltG [Saprospiraceae bacterium]MCB9305585.1 endolytic transglycosylase MltG [Lewinellaceae bacterium]MCB9355019.1 endolytic transglycosylase MltG [Lewinellaceae bacterium]
MKARKSSLSRYVLLFFTAALLIGAYFAWRPLKAIYFSGVPAQLENKYVCIPTGSTFDQVVAILRSGGFIRDEADFRWLAEKMNYKKDIMRAGRFEVRPGWTNRQLIQHLRTGEQAPVKVILNNERLPEDVASKVSQFIEADSLSLIRTFSDQAFLDEIGYTYETLIAAFIPNTYEMYWNTDARAFVKRMLKEHDAFWNKNNRHLKARNLGLSETEVYVLASIVERETNDNGEKPVIAGVYLNRLRIGMKLQADPTSVFATRDFTTRRVTEYHTTYDSPYNTYVYKGLPPGPISMASITSIDAVLNPQKHDYLYFCARPDESGTHVFAETFAAHKVNADRFQTYVRQRRN